MNTFEKILKAKIQTSDENGTLRKLKSRSAYLEDFVSNDYLGLARSEELFKRIASRAENIRPHLNGATGSRLLAGNDDYIEQVEQKLAGIFQGETSLIFNSGYTANLAVLSSIPQKGDTILYDERIHASIKDGLRLSLATRYPFRHNDVSDLSSKIARAKSRCLFVAIESIYSMDGDESPLEEIIHIAKKNNATIILDEAHSTGMYGERGEGLAVSNNFHDKIDIRIYTFGKAMGIHGACVVGSAHLREYLINFARPFIYTTALPFHNISAIECAFDHLSENIHLQSLLKTKVGKFLLNLKIQSRTSSSSAIQTAIFPGNANVKAAAAKLQASGFDVRPILSPTVPKGSERLRICLHTFNSDKQIEALANTLNQLAHSIH